MSASVHRWGIYYNQQDNRYKMLSLYSITCVSCDVSTRSVGTQRCKQCDNFCMCASCCTKHMLAGTLSNHTLCYSHATRECISCAGRIYNNDDVSYQVFCNDCVAKAVSMA